MPKRKPTNRQFEVPVTTDTTVLRDLLWFGMQLYQDAYATAQDLAARGKSTEEIHYEVLSKFGDSTAARIDDLRRMMEYHLKRVRDEAVKDVLSGKPPDYRRLMLIG